jgi:hypothetical protein
MTNREALEKAMADAESAHTEPACRKALLAALKIYLPAEQAEATMQAIRDFVPVSFPKLKLPVGVLRIATRYKMIRTATPAKGRSSGGRRLAAMTRLEWRKGG